MKDDTCPTCGSKNFENALFEEAKNYCNNCKKFWFV